MSAEQSVDAERVRIVRGAPDSCEVAALVAVLCAQRGAAPAPATGYAAWRSRRLAALRGGAPRP